MRDLRFVCRRSAGSGRSGAARGVYVESLDEAADALGLLPAETGANVLLVAAFRFRLVRG